MNKEVMTGVDEAMKILIDKIKTEGSGEITKGGIGINVADLKALYDLRHKDDELELERAKFNLEVDKHRDEQEERAARRELEKKQLNVGRWGVVAGLVRSAVSTAIKVATIGTVLKFEETGVVSSFVGKTILRSEVLPKD